MKRLHLQGIVPPNITPFDSEGNVYEDGLRRHIEFLLPHIGGLYTCGTYGSGPLMSVTERKRVVEIVVDQVRGRVPVVVHVGTTDTSSAVELAKHANSVGATAVAIIPPFYYKHTEDAIFEHYRAVMKAVSIPIYAYDNPQASGNKISPHLLARLADIGVWGIKDSSFDICDFIEKQRAVGERDFDFVIGTEALFLPAYIMGARACVAGLANAFPELMADLWRATCENDLSTARKIQHKVLDVRDIVHLGPTIPTVHAILQMRGVDAGFPRAPFQPLEAGLRTKIRAALTNAGML
ncbi:MAG: dihydrodipicolinate synthase family protein [Chloroflexi bacterium]|nr:dihydrodipicolinate synthase family protein [Chloroflexota bacterium]